MMEAHNRTILIVDDSAIDRMLLCNILSGSFRILEAADGEEAFYLLRETPGIDMVITDLHMPVMDGFALLKAMAADENLNSLPVIAVAEEDDQAAQLQALEAGVIDIVTKPYFAERVLNRVQSLTTLLSCGKNAGVFERGELQKQILWQQEHDALTGLYNKNGFYLNARICLDRHPDTHYLLVRGDIDRFKAFNDTFGLPAGDELLIAIGQRMQEMQGENVIFARLDADHFVMLLSRELFKTDEYSKLLTNLLNSYPTPFRLACSVGVYDIIEPELEIALMCDRALMALQTAKNGYANKVAYYDDALRQSMLKEQQLTGEMFDALASGQFQVYFQPQVNYTNGQLIGAEALVRWMHPEQGMISPGEFIPLFEKNGFISKLDEYVWEESCQYMRKWYDQKGKLLPVSVSVNISRVDLYDETLCARLLALVSKYGLSPADLRLEITENVYMEDSKKLIEIVSKLRTSGFSVEMDDFGSGYSSLNMLKDVLVDRIKIDMCFLSAAKDESRSGNILSSIIRMAHGVKMSVLAEGVETREQADYLKSLGCLYMQGYYFSRPMPAEEFEKLLDVRKIDPQGVDHFYTAVDGSADFLSAKTQDTLLFNSFVGGAGIFEYAGGIVTALRTNDSFFEMLGISAEEYAPWRDRVLDCISPETRVTFIEMLETAEKTGLETSCETYDTRLSKGDQQVWLFNRARFLARKAEAGIFYIAVENISERKRLSKQLEEQSTNLQALYSSIPCGIVQYGYVDGQRKTVRYNDASWKLLGYTDARQYADAVQQQASLEHVHPDDLPKLIKCVSMVDSTGEPTELDHRILCADGTLRWVHTKIQNITDLDGNQLQQTACMDITSLKQAEARYEQEALELQTIINSIPGGVATYEYRGDSFVPIYVSDGLLKLLGQNIEEYSAPLIFGSSGIYEKDESRVMKAIANIMETGKELDINYRYLRSDGTLAWINLRGRRMGERNGYPVLHGVFYNLSTVSELYDRVLNESADGLIVADRDTYELLFVNDAAAAVAGQPKELAAGRPCYEFLRHRDSPCEGCKAKDLGDEMIMSEYDYGERHYLARFSHIQWNGHDAFISYMSDRTEVHNAQLKADAILHNIPCGVSVFKVEEDQILRIYLSDRAYEVLGNSKTDEPAVNFSETFERVHPDDQEKLHAEIRGIRSERRIFNLDMRILPKDGGVRWVNLTAAPVMMEDGLYYYGIYSDISERKAREEAQKLAALAMNELAEHNAGGVLYNAWQAYFANTDDLMFIKDINLVYLGVSKAFADMVGVSDPQQIVGKTDFDLFADKELARRYTQDDMRILQNGTALENYIEPITSADGKQRHSSTSKYVIRDESGVIIGLYGVGRKIVEQMSTEGYQAILEQRNLRFCHYTVKNRTVHFSGTEHYTAPSMHIPHGPEAAVEKGAIAPESKEKWLGIFDAIDRGEKSGEVEICFKNAQGEYRWNNVRFTGIADMDGNPVSAIISYAPKGTFDDLIRAGLSMIPGDDKQTFEAAFSRCIDELNGTLELSSSELENYLRYGSLIHQFAPGMLAVHYYTNSAEKPFISGNLLREYGYADEQVQCLADSGNMLPIIFHEDLPYVEEKLNTFKREKPESYVLEYRVVKKDGSLAWVTAHGTRFSDSFGSGYICIYTDSTERRTLMEQLRTNGESDRLVVKNSDRYIFRVSLPDGIAKIPKRAQEQFALPEILNDTPSDLIERGNLDEISAEEYRTFCRDIKAGIPCRQEFMLHGKFADEREVWLRLQYALITNKSGKANQAIIYADDMTEMKNRENRLVKQAERDSLTGLYDRGTTEQHIRLELQRADYSCVLLSIDLDNMKEINDLHGHAQGDRALSAIAKELTLHFRSTDIIGRFGGDEFIVFLPGFGDKKMLDTSLSLLLRRLSTITVGENNEQAIHCSIGAAIGSNTDDFDDIYHHADLALYHVKRHGKNDYAFYDKAMEHENYLFKTHASLSYKNALVWGSTELRSLADAMATFYPLVISANISRNNLYLIESAHFINSLLPESGTADDFVGAAVKAIHPADRESFIRIADRAHLLSLYESGQDSLNLYCRVMGDDGDYHWVQIIIVMYKNDMGDICGFTFTRLSPEREHEQQMGRMQKIMELAVESVFQYLCVLHPESGTYEVCANSEDVLCKVPQKGDYDTVVRSIRDTHVVPQDRGSYYENTLMAHVMEQMKLLEKYSFQYRLADGIREAAFYWCDPSYKEILMTIRRVK